MWIKICGVTSVADAVLVADAGADAVGLNFYPASKRYVDGSVSPSPSPDLRPLSLPDGANNRSALITHARSLRDAVTDRLEVVGVFVNASARKVAETAAAVMLDTVQFHGDESAELIAEFHRLAPDVSIIRAFRVSNCTVAMDEHLQQLNTLNVPVKAVLVDAFVDGEYGGTGHTVNTAIVNSWKQTGGSPYQLILAGGLKPGNVAVAAAAIQPWGVDTASGVESSPGVKCSALVTDFVQAGRAVEG